MLNKLIVKFEDETLMSFEPTDTIQSILDFFNNADLSEDELEEVEIKAVEEVESEDDDEDDDEDEEDKTKTEVKESIEEVNPDNEWVIWSSSDLAEGDEQRPLVKIKKNEAGELEAEAVGDDAIDKESLVTASRSLKSSVGKPIKDRILRVDKSLNHNDPWLSTELRRAYIQGDRGNKKQPISKLLKGVKPEDIPDVPTEREIDTNFNPRGMDLLADNVLLILRDELKAAANTNSRKKEGPSEESLVKTFSDLTGVDYYTEEVVDKDQYAYILDLLGRSSDKFNDTYVEPHENKYIMYLKDLTEDLIEKILLKDDPDFYKL